VTGPDSDLDGLIQRSAESLYRLTQPYRYAIYAGNHGRADEAEALFRDLADRGPPADRSWANNGLSMPTSDRFGVDAALDMLEQGAKIEPANAIIRLNEVMLEIQKSRPEQALHHVTDLLARPPGESSGIIRAEAIPLIHLGAQAQSDILQGAYIDAAIKQEIVNKSRIAGRYGLPAIPAQIATHAHDPATARAIFDRYISPGSQNLMRGISTLYDAWTRAMIATELQDWRGVLSEANTLDPVLPAFPGLRTITPTTIVPLTAYAKAELGDFASAEAAIAATPPNCYDCLIARARIAELNGEHDRADFWFARAVHDAPTIPFAYSNWGEALLARGHADAAIEQFKLANQKGPHFADPLEGWGEALMAKNQSHLALAKFAEAEKYAPNWGRLHLKWGEALVYAGKKNEAKAQFIRAAQLDLTTAERFELARVGPHD
jgi:tetratricopeptide (TPR) repeat protein